MPIKRYMPSPERIKEEFSRELRYKLRAQQRGPRKVRQIPDNSVPWMENPKTLSDLWEISQRVQDLVDRFYKWSSASKSS